MYTFESDKMRFPISDGELERRWALVRVAMKKEDIDVLVMQNDHQYRSGMVRYFTDIGSLSNPVTVIFPYDDEMTVIANGGGYNPAQTPAWGCRGVKTRLGVPIFPTYVDELNTKDAQAVIDLIKKRGDKKVGLVRISSMLGCFYKYITENLDGVELVEFTDQIDKIKAVKSPEEIEYVRKSAKIQDYVAAAVPTFLRPGKYEYEIRNEIRHLLCDLGSEEQLIMIGSAPIGERAGHNGHFFQNRRIEKGDQVFIMLEPNGPGGYWTELSRTWVLGEPSKDLLDIWADGVKAQAYTASLLVPGNTGAMIYQKYNDYLEKNGYEKETRIHAHGQGYDLMERPGVRGEDPMPIQLNMNIAIHPTLARNGAYISVTDNFLVTENGPERLHQFPQEIIIIN